MATRVLIVDDDLELTGLLEELLGPEGYVVDAYGTGRGAAESGQTAARQLPWRADP